MNFEEVIKMTRRIRKYNLITPRKYSGKVTQIEIKKHIDYGSYIQITFELLDGTYAGLKIFSKFLWCYEDGESDIEIGQKSMAGEWFATLGQSDPKKDIDFEDCYGNVVIVEVKVVGESQYSRVENIYPYDENQTSDNNDESDL